VIVVPIVVLGAAGCAVKKTRHVSPATVAPAAVPESAADLLARLQKRHDAIQTLSATVELEPTTGSVYSGIIKQYHDLRAFVLVQAPADIRMLGQAPVVRATIFDMSSDGKQFRVWVPSKNKFIVGSTETTAPARNQLENLRPQHILEALIPPSGESTDVDYFANQDRESDRIYYVLNFVTEDTSARSADRLALLRKVWFDASTLELVRVQFYDAAGAPVEDVRYSAYQDYGGVRYPSHIELSRPVEDYSLGISVQRATFNQPIAADKFVLAKPPNAEEIRLGTNSGEVKSLGQ
jgi:outer membrane lipoprotein-sorting protein